jgi:hypothetical protein
MNTAVRPNGIHKADSTVVAPEAVREQVERLLTDPVFQSSQRSSNLVKFIVDCTLKGQNDCLKERFIGIQVFGRNPDYDTSNDPTVRVAASDLRKRLAHYYSRTEHEQELRIDIPVRSYVAEFKIPEQNPSRPEETAKPRVDRGRYVWASIALVLLAVCVTGRWLLPMAVIDRFWEPVSSGSGPALICIGSSFDRNAVATNSVPSNDSAAPRTPLYGVIEHHLDVAPMAVTAAEDLAAYLHSKGQHSMIRPVAGAELSDLRFKPVVLYGMFLNEWAVKLGADPRFRLRDEPDHGLRWIEDRNNPSSRNWSLNMSAPFEEVDNDYALISRIHDPSTGQWWIGIAGLTGVGTLAANRMLIDPSAMSTLGPSLPKGWDQKNLQIILEVKLVQGRNPGATRVLVAYAW